MGPPIQCSPKASERSILRALHKRNIRFRKLREKPKLTAEDMKERFAFAKAYHKKTKTWWASHLHASIDGKCFQVVGQGDFHAPGGSVPVRLHRSL